MSETGIEIGRVDLGWIKDDSVVPSFVCLHQWLLPFVVLDHVVDFVCMSASRHV